MTLWMPPSKIFLYGMTAQVTHAKSEIAAWHTRLAEAEEEVKKVTEQLQAAVARREQCRVSEEVWKREYNTLMAQALHKGNPILRI